MAGISRGIKFSTGSFAAASKTGVAAKRKGTTAEREVCDILVACGVPSQLVIASGAAKGAEGDIKVGVKLNKHGQMPDRDESESVIRGEIKNQKVTYKAGDKLFEILELPPNALDLPFVHLEQSAKTRVLFWKRRKAPQGSLTGDYNRAYLAIMGIKDFAEVIQTILSQRATIKQLKKRVRELEAKLADV